jgi:hypothetical protein
VVGVVASVAVGGDGELMATPGDKFWIVLKEVMKCRLGMDVGTLGRGIMGIEYRMDIPMDIYVEAMAIPGVLCPRKMRWPCLKSRRNG